MIDLRSDTVTVPTPGMLETMFQAKVGDDVFSEDTTVNQLQNIIAQMFGMESALFCPSGTMTNQIAIKVHTQPGDEVICDKLSHIYNYEGGGIAFNSSASVRLLNGINGTFTADMVEENINPDNIHHPATKLVAVENTVNKGGGSIYQFSELEKISTICKKYNLKFHLDGARLFNALAETGDSTIEYGRIFDTISICLSKGLGAPVGSLLLGNKQTIDKARRIRKVLGGAMRQAGYLAAAGIYALQNNVSRLKTDNDNARKIATQLAEINYIESILPVETNIIIFKINHKITELEFAKKCAEQNILVSTFGKQTIRLVTHLQFSNSDISDLIRGFKNISFNYK